MFSGIMGFTVILFLNLTLALQTLLFFYRRAIIKKPPTEGGDFAGGFYSFHTRFCGYSVHCELRFHSLYGLAA